MARRYLTNFTAADMQALAAPETAAAAATATVTRTEPDKPLTAERSSEVPVGTAKEILAWVDDDADRALEAYNKEYQSPDPRVTLLTSLEATVDR